MSLPSLHSKVTEVQSLLSELKNSLPQLPVESQNSISTELEGFARQLSDWLKEHNRKPENRETTPSEYNDVVRHTQESDAWLDLVMKQAHLGAWRWDLIHGKVKWVADLHGLLGVELAEEVSDPKVFFEMIHPDDRNTVIQELNIAIEAGGAFYLEFRVISGDGKPIWLSSAGMVEHDLSGRPILVTGINQDITHHKRIEEAFHESEERERAKVAELQALMDAVPAIIWISRDPECKEMVGNRYGYEFLHMWEGANISKTAPATELDQQPYRNFKNGQEIPNNELPMQVAASTGVGTSNYEFDLVFKNGVTRNVLGNVVPLIDQSGKPSGAVAVFVDITERKRIEEELRRSEHRLRVALATAPMTVFSTDKDLRYQWLYNLRHSLTEEHFLDKRADEVFPPEDVRELIELQRSVIETGQTVLQEIRMRINDAWFSYIVAMDPVRDQTGRVNGLVGAAFDITAQRRLEVDQRNNEIQVATQRHLMQTRENERVNIAREIHDGPLQTLMTMIFDIHILKEEYTEEKRTDRLTPLESNLKIAIQELRQVVNELRPPAAVDFGLVNAIQEYAYDVCEKSPGIDLEMDLDEGALNFGEELNLTIYRICQEALQNVVRHSEATRVNIQLLLENDQILFRIKDNGVGFSFKNDFTQLIADKHFGLTGMAERAEAVGGTFQIFSKPGEGTEIKVIFPIRVDCGA